MNFRSQYYSYLAGADKNFGMKSTIMIKLKNVVELHRCNFFIIISVA